LGKINQLSCQNRSIRKPNPQQINPHGQKENHGSMICVGDESPSLVFLRYQKTTMLSISFELSTSRRRSRIKKRVEMIDTNGKSIGFLIIMGPKITQTKAAIFANAYPPIFG